MLDPSSTTLEGSKQKVNLTQHLFLCIAGTFGADTTINIIFFLKMAACMHKIIDLLILML